MNEHESHFHVKVNKNVNHVFLLLSDAGYITGSGHEII